MLEKFLNMLNDLATDEKNKKIDASYEEVEEALKGEKIPNKLGGFSSMTVELLKLFTNNKKFYNELIEKNNSSITLHYIDSVGFDREYDFNKFKIIDALDWAYENDKLNEEEIENLKLLKMSAEFSNFIDKYSGVTASFYIEDRMINLPINDLINIVTSKSRMNKIIKDGKYNDLSLDEFAYLVETFLLDNHILDTYYIPDSVSFNLNLLRDASDIVYINRCLEPNYNYIRRVNVSDELKDLVTSNMNPSFDDLEKAFYIYYKLCTILSYDEEYFARRDNEGYVEKHRDIERLKSIDSTNNKIVCYEFNAIYAKLLKDMGIKFEVNDNASYGHGHASLTFRVGKFLVDADSTKKLVKSDLALAKNNIFLSGFSLENTKESTYIDFLIKLENVYKYINEEDAKEIHGNCRDFSKVFKKIPVDLNLEEKTSLFINLSNESSLSTMDKIPYELHMKKKLFERENSDKTRFSINYISKEESLFDKKYTASKIITYNNNGVDDIKNNHYIEVSSSGAVDYLDYDEVKYKLRNGKFRGIINDHRTIPGFSISDMQGVFTDNSNNSNDKIYSNKKRTL